MSKCVLCSVSLIVVCLGPKLILIPDFLHSRLALKPHDHPLSWSSVPRSITLKFSTFVSRPPSILNFSTILFSFFFLLGLQAEAELCFWSLDKRLDITALKAASHIPSSEHPRSSTRAAHTRSSIVCLQRLPWISWLSRTNEIHCMCFVGFENPDLH